MEAIKVYVVNKGRKNLYLRYLDPHTGRAVEKTAKTAKQSDAMKEAGKWQDELQTGRYQAPSRMTWEIFRQRHAEHILSGMKPSTAGAYDSALNVFEKLANPRKLSDITTARVTAFATKLREQGRAPATIARHLRHLKVVLRWAQRQGYLLKLPTFEMPKGAQTMRGRAITLEEFERMLTATPKSVGELAADSFRFYLRGLWASGLRLEESLALCWDERPGAIVVDLTGRRPLLRIPGAAQKNGRDQLYPITPEFAELLATVPEDERHGRVFRLLTKTGKPMASTRHMVGPKVSAIGKAAGVVTALRDRKGDVVKEFASAHDLRRAFGFRWSRKVLPTVLRELMRHSEIKTTLVYYVGQDAEATADALWATLGDTFVDTPRTAEGADSANPYKTSTGGGT